jgi:hypothetical protein
MKSRKMRRQMRRIKRKTTRKRGGRAQTTPVTLQIFVYNTDRIVDTNNYPLLSFENKGSMHNFITSLISRDARRLNNEPYFVINNPQNLPANVRRMYREMDGQEWDSCYSVRDNLSLLRQQNIDNNTTSNYGFSDALQSFI